MPEAETDNHKQALIVDYGGVLTTNIWDAFGSFCEREGLEQDTVLQLFRGDSEALAVLRGLETGQLPDEEFERRFGALVGVADHTGLIGRMFADLRPEEMMIAALRRAHEAGIRTGLITNSWGLGIYERAPTDLFDAAVISGEVGMHKPQADIYLLACERLGIEPAEAVFVDDLRENCEGAEAVGMTAILHRDPAKTIGRLEDLLAVELAAA